MDVFGNIHSRVRTISTKLANAQASMDEYSHFDSWDEREIRVNSKYFQALIVVDPPPFSIRSTQKRLKG